MVGSSGKNGIHTLCKGPSARPDLGTNNYYKKGKKPKK